MAHHIETSLLICKANQLIGFYRTIALTASHFRKDYNAILKKEKIFQKGIFYFLFPLSAVLREILRLQYKPYTTISLRRQLLGFQALISFLIFSRFSMFLIFLAIHPILLVPSMIYFQPHGVQS